VIDQTGRIVAIQKGLLTEGAYDGQISKLLGH
jgi:hypothetical protein